MVGTKFELVEVVDEPRLVQLWLDLPKELYSGNPAYIHPLDQDVQYVFDANRNNRFKHGGRAARWLLKHEGKWVGRIAAFFDDKELKRQGSDLIGSFGFFECIEDQEAASALFLCAQGWLQQQGYEGMEGPVNFGSRDNWWGLQIAGHEHQPIYGMPYSQPYYQALFSNFGFQTYFEQITYHRVNALPLSEVIMYRVERLKRDPAYRFEEFNWREADRFIQAFVDVYAQAWVKHTDAEPLTFAQVKSLLLKAKPILNPGLVRFTYHNDRPVGFFLMLPDINTAVKAGYPNRSLWDKLRFIYTAKFKLNKLIGVIFGVVPDFQKRGVEAAMLFDSQQFILQQVPHFREIELNWIGDFNPPMHHLLGMIGCTEQKRHATFRYMFDPNVAVVRHPTIGA